MPLPFAPLPHASRRVGLDPQWRGRRAFGPETRLRLLPVRPRGEVPVQRLERPPGDLLGEETTPVSFLPPPEPPFRPAGGFRDATAPYVARCRRHSNRGPPRGGRARPARDVPDGPAGHLRDDRGGPGPSSDGACRCSTRACCEHDVSLGFPGNRESAQEELDRAGRPTQCFLL